MNKKIRLLTIALVVIAVGGFAAYSIAKPKPKVTTKINGNIYWLQRQFTLNLAGGQYATLSVALLLPPTQSLGKTSPTDPPPTGIGSLTDEAVIRAIITNDITGVSATELLTRGGRVHLESEILKNINAQTDTKVTAIYFTDLAVQ
ncbi:MAG: flagellar basal body-associated FliL family protein [Solirubrobacteraceae bacterium]